MRGRGEREAEDAVASVKELKEHWMENSRVCHSWHPEVIFALASMCVWWGWGGCHNALQLCSLQEVAIRDSQTYQREEVTMGLFATFPFYRCRTRPFCLAHHPCPTKSPR